MAEELIRGLGNRVGETTQAEQKKKELIEMRIV